MHHTLKLYDEEDTLATAEDEVSEALQIQIEAGDDEAKAAALAQESGADCEDDWSVGFRLYTFDDDSQLAFHASEFWLVTESFIVEVADNRGDDVPSDWMPIATRPGIAAIYPSEGLADEAIELLQVRDAKNGEQGRWAYRTARARP
jgi:hypothetical protein